MSIIQICSVHQFVDCYGSLLFRRSCHHFLDKFFIFDVSVQIFFGSCEFENGVNVDVCQALSERCEDVSEFGRVDEALAFAVECLERLHEVSESSGIGVGADLFVDRENLFELVLLLAELFRSTVGEDYCLRRIQAAASQEVADLESVDEPIATVPEVEQVEHLAYVFNFARAEIRHVEWSNVERVRRERTSSEDTTSDAGNV